MWNTAPKWVRPVSMLLFIGGAVGLKLTGSGDLSPLLGNITLGVTVVSGLLGAIIGKNK